jgi:hypothetical protein
MLKVCWSLMHGLPYNHFNLYSHFVLLNQSHQFLEDDQTICTCCLHEESLSNECLSPLLCCKGNEEERDEDKTAGALHCACDAFSVMVKFLLPCYMV